MTPGSTTSVPPPILVVEDEALIRAGLVMEFECAGLTVREASNAEEAVALLESGMPVAAVVTDLRMPGRIDGSFLVAWLGRHKPKVPVVVVSGYGADILRDQSLDVAAVVSKPYDGIALVSMLKKLIAPRRATS